MAPTIPVGDRQKITAAKLLGLKMFHKLCDCAAGATGGKIAKPRDAVDRRMSLSSVGSQNSSQNSSLSTGASASGSQMGDFTSSDDDNQDGYAMPQEDLEDYDELSTAKKTKKSASKINAWTKLKSRPNVHQGIHMDHIAAQHATAYNTNVLIFEDKHR